MNRCQVCQGEPLRLVWVVRIVITGDTLTFCHEHLEAFLGVFDPEASLVLTCQEVGA